MPPIPAPGVAMARIRGTVGPNPWAVVFHAYAGTPAPYTQSQINALGQAFNQRTTTHLIPMWSSTVKFIATSVADLTDSTQRIYESPLGNTPGTVPTVPPTLAACILVSHRIAARYRGGHPRSYLPPSGIGSTSTGDDWTAGVVSTWQTAFNAFAAGITSDMAAAGLPNCTLCAPRYTYNYVADNVKHKFVKTRVGYTSANPITSSVVSGKIATQRRRLGV